MDSQVLYKRKVYMLAQTFFIQDNQRELSLNAHKYDFDMLFFDQMVDFLQAVTVADESDLFVVDLDVLYSLQKANDNRTMFLRDLFKLLPAERDYVYLQTEKQSGRFLLQQMLVDSNCQAYAEKPISNENLIEKLFNLFAQNRNFGSSSVLLLGEGQRFELESLTKRDIQLLEHSDAHSLHLMVKQHQPVVVIIDEPHYRRTDAIARIIKKNLEGDPGLEIILLADHHDEVLVRAAIKDGFDAIFFASAPDVLTRQLINRVKKIRVAKDLISRDRATGLLNKIGFQRRAQEVIKKAEVQGVQLGMCVVDIDKFKTINDTWGHYFGDIVIKRLSLHLNGFMGEHDLLSRFGGEEFVMLFWDAQPARLREKLDSMRQAFNALVFEVEPGENKQFSFSGGVAFFPEIKSQNELFLHADEMLYKAKQGGRNQICG